jgi:preprotein translocase subunit SecA
MRLFNSERLAKLMDKMGHQEGEVLQHNMVSKSIERAQKKVEENNFGIRKRLLEYDDVMNIQREAIYKKRNNALSGERLSVDLYNLFSSLTENIVSDYKSMGNFEGFRNECLRVLGNDPDFNEDEFKSAAVDVLTEKLQKETTDLYNEKFDKIREVLLPVIQRVHENEGHRYKRIAVPFTDGSRTPLPISADLERAIDTEGSSIVKDIEKAVSLSIIDNTWKEHLRAMDELKDSVQAASFEQKDPLVIYKMEAYELFERLIYNINEEVSTYLMRGKLVINVDDNLREAKQQRTDLSKTSASRSEDMARRRAAEGVSRQRAKPETFKRATEKVKRNDPCPCGSGKKYKQCHGKK